MSRLKVFLIVGLLLCFIIPMAIADDAADGDETTEDKSDGSSGKYYASALAVGLGAIASAAAISIVGAAAAGATAEKPEVFGKVLIFVALAEALAIYGLVIALMILLL